MPTTQTANSVQDAREALLATLDSVEPIVTMSHEDLVVIALGSKVGRPGADYLTLADSHIHPTPFEFTELDAGGSVPTACRQRWSRQRARPAAAMSSGA